MKIKCIMGIDLAGVPKNPSGWALWERNVIRTGLLYSDREILEKIIISNPALIAIDAPFSLPKRGSLRKADREMIKGGYRVFPPTFSAMKKLTLRAIRLNRLIGKKRYSAIEVYPTSTRKALGMPVKARGEIQKS